MSDKADIPTERVPAETVTIESITAQIDEIGRKADRLINGVCRQRDEARAAFQDLLAIARDISTMDCFYANAKCPDGCDCIAARASRAVDKAEGR